MSNRTHGIRHIGPLGIETPLLVPSFSSRGFPEVGGMLDALRADIGDLCLVSTFDLAHEHLPDDFEMFANVVLLDSGLYETAPAPVAVDAYLPEASGKSWTREDYVRFLVSAAPRIAMTNTIVVSFDAYAPLSEQAKRARDDFKGIAGAAFDFLVKPPIQGQFHDNLNPTVDDIEGFDVLGVTEKELGRSALDRCRALLRLRIRLGALGSNIPIHVFGSITPAAVTAYFLCGADVFDGLNWLRVGLEQPWAGAPSEFAVAHGLSHLDDHAVLIELWRRNLRTLRRTQAALRRHSDDGDDLALTTALPFAPASLELARVARDAEGV